MPVDPQIADLLAFIAASGTPMADQTPEEARKSFRTLTVDMVKPEDVVAVGSVEEMTVAGRPARVYRPEGAGERPTLVFLHGGGFVIGDLDTHDQTCRRLCVGADAVVVSVDYRLAPEHPYPAGVDDTLAAVEWASEHLAELGGSDMLAVGGDSAGANLSAIAAQLRPELVKAQVLIYPVVDPMGDYPSRVENAEGYFLDTSTMEWFFAHYATGVSELDPSDIRVSPLKGDLTGVAPAVVFTAEFDPLRDEGEAYADKLEAAGVAVDRQRYDGMIHGFIDMGPFSPGAAAAVADVVARTRKLLHG